MNTIQNTYRKIFVKAIVSAICLGIATFIVYSYFKQSPPNLLLFTIVSFAGFYLLSLAEYKIKHKFTKKQ